MGGGGGRRGSGIGWVGDGQSLVAACLARRRARLSVLEASEALLAERGLPIPPRPPWFMQVWWSIQDLVRPPEPK
jgi:hypothetical protein